MLVPWRVYKLPIVLTYHILSYQNILKILHERREWFWLQAIPYQEKCVPPFLVLPGLIVASLTLQKLRASPRPMRTVALS